MISYRGISVISSLVIWRGVEGETLSYRGISVITPLRFAGGDEGGS